VGLGVDESCNRSRQASFDLSTFQPSNTVLTGLSDKLSARPPGPLPPAVTQKACVALNHFLGIVRAVRYGVKKLSFFFGPITVYR
jgi:hypothetical protein